MRVFSLRAKLQEEVGSQPELTRFHGRPESFHGGAPDVPLPPRLPAGVPASDDRSGRSREALSRAFEPSAAAIAGRVRRTEAEGGTRPDVVTAAERGELGRLRRENRQLRQKRDMLAKGEPSKAPSVRARWRTPGAQRRTPRAGLRADADEPGRPSHPHHGLCAGRPCLRRLSLARSTAFGSARRRCRPPAPHPHDPRHFARHLWRATGSSRAARGGHACRPQAHRPADARGQDRRRQPKALSGAAPNRWRRAPRHRHDSPSAGKTGGRGSRAARFLGRGSLQIVERATCATGSSPMASDITFVPTAAGFLFLAPRHRARTGGAAMARSSTPGRDGSSAGPAAATCARGSSSTHSTWPWPFASRTTSSITRITAGNIRLWLSAFDVARRLCVPRRGARATPATTPWASASLPPSRAS